MNLKIIKLLGEFMTSFFFLKKKKGGKEKDFKRILYYNLHLTFLTSELNHARLFE